MAETLVLPDHRDTVVVVGTSVRKPLAVLSAYLSSLDAQELPPRVRLVPVFVPDFAPDQKDAQDYLFRWVNERGGTLIQGFPSSGKDFADDPGLQSHEWQPSSMARVGANKNLLIQHALAHKADYLFFADADLILDRTTVASLLSCDKPIVTATYWTRWQRSTNETGRIDAGPQVWLQHPYGLEGRGMDAAEFRTKLLSREVTRVWGFGACTLIQRKVLEAGISFEFLPDVPMQGLMAGEDRHFCIRCERMPVDAYADNWPDIFHIYHAPDDVDRIPAMQARLLATHPDQPKIGDLVSLRLRALEPIPVAPNRMSNARPEYLRGRLGAIAFLPELEQAILGMTRGSTAIVKVHFPIHYPLPYLRGRVRLIEVMLIDCKPNGYPPVVEEDMYANVDTMTLTPPQRLSLVDG